MEARWRSDVGGRQAARRARAGTAIVGCVSPFGGTMKNGLAMASATLLLFVWSPVAETRPYRLINARTPRTTEGGDLELGLRYQGLFAGEGFGFDPRSFHQIAATLR